MKKRNCGHLVNMGSVAGHYAYATGTGTYYYHNLLLLKL